MDSNTITECEDKYIIYDYMSHKFTHPLVKSVCNCVRIDSFMDTNDEYLNILYKILCALHNLFNSGWIYKNKITGITKKQIFAYNIESSVLHLCKDKAYLTIDLIVSKPDNKYRNFSFSFTVRDTCISMKIGLGKWTIIT